MAQGLRQFATRPGWRPGARIFTGRGLRDASGRRPRVTWPVTARGSVNGTDVRTIAELRNRRLRPSGAMARSE